MENKSTPLGQKKSPTDGAEHLEVKISVDTIPAIDGMASLLREIGSLAELTAKCLEEGVELTTLDGDVDATPATNDCRTVLKMNHKLVLLVGALRACNRDARALINFE